MWWRPKPLNEAEKQLQEKYHDKRVRVIADLLFSPKSVIIGKCDFIGYNQLLNKKQITIDRMPIFVESYEDLKLEIIE